MPGVSRKPGFDVPWGIGFLVLCAVLLALHLYGFEQALRALDAAYRNRATDFLIAQRAWEALAYIAVLIQIGLFCAVRYKCNVEKVTGLVPYRFPGYLVPAAACGVFLAATKAGIYLGFIGGDVYVWHLSREATGAHLFATCLRGALVIPIFEEFLNRGLLYSWLRQHWTCAPSVLLSSSVFALMHGWSEATVLHFLSGVVYALSYERTRALAFPVIAHGTLNLLSFLLAILLTELSYYRKVWKKRKGDPTLPT